MKARIILTAVLAMSLASTSMAQSSNVIKIGGGGGPKNGSTYSRIIEDYATFCSNDQLNIKEVQSRGGNDNLAALQGNTEPLAIIPSDLLFKAKSENGAAVANLKTLFGLHPEALHLIVRGDTKKEGGYGFGSFKFGASSVAFDTIEALKGRPVGAVGGTIDTVKIISEFLKLNLQVQPFNSTKDMLAALAAGQVDAVMVVAGAPSDAVKTVPSQFKLLPIRPNGDLMSIGVYQQTKIQYPNLNNGAAVDTLSTQALMVTRTFSSKGMTDKLGALRKCFYANLDNIKDKEGTHPAWQNIEAKNHGMWTYYDLPGSP